MAGSLHYTVKTRHVYQRRFTTSALDEALSNCHWYLVARRPAVRLMPETLQVNRDRLSVTMRSRRSIDGPELVLPLQTDIGVFGNASDFRTHVDGSYFSGRVGETTIHGDAWALGCLLTNAATEFSELEVIYAGQAGDLKSRLDSHSTIQRIYEDHSGSDWDIFVVPLYLDSEVTSSDDPYDDVEPGYDLMQWMELLMNSRDKPVQQLTIDLIEHAIISHFAPAYNAKLKNWDPRQPTKPMSKMMEIGLRILVVHIDGWGGLARFYSESANRKTRGQYIQREIPPPNKRGNPIGIREWGFARRVYDDGEALFASADEASSAALTMFGEEAPEVRAPEEYYIDRDLRKNARRGWTEPIEDTRPRPADERIDPYEPFPSPPFPSFSGSTGQVAVWATMLEESQPWALRKLQLGPPAHGLIVCDDDAIGLKLLTALVIEAAKSRRFRIVSVSTASKPVAWDQWLGAFEENLTSRDRSLSYLRSVNFFCSSSKPVTRPVNISRLVLILDCEQFFADSELARELALLMRGGPRAGVGVLVTLNDSELLRAQSELARELLKAESIAPLQAGGRPEIEEAKVLQQEPRFSSSPASDMTTFVLHYSEENSTVGQVVATLDPKLSAKAAQRSARELLPQKSKFGNWTTSDEFSNSWYTFDAISAAQWYLYRHDDSWQVVAAYSRYGRGRDDTVGDRLEWAQGALAQRFSFEVRDWRIGPGYRPNKLIALYLDIDTQSIISFGRPGSIIWNTSSRPIRAELIAEVDQSH